LERELAGKVALVTGATRMRGLGRATAVVLAGAGADVVVTGTASGTASRPKDEVQAGWRGFPDVVAELESLGVRARGIAVDVTDANGVQAMVREAVTCMGRIDILVNNATYPRGSDRVPVVDLDDSVWRRIVDVNLTGTMLCCKYVAREMILQGDGGSIVNISSGAALKAPATFSAYAASKAAVHALTSALAAELGPHGITCNVVAPGFLDTARIDMLRTPDKWTERLTTIPIPRAGQPAEVAQLVRFLCGPHARWMSGDALLINGGEVRRAAG
jgi:NAD(P)-dependent dehydrogenase (short-subunit alcohol dehydrogenase family)